VRSRPYRFLPRADRDFKVRRPIEDGLLVDEWRRP
jgi:hypothetical protein